MPYHRYMARPFRDYGNDDIRAARKQRARETGRQYFPRVNNDGTASYYDDFEGDYFVDTQAKFNPKVRTSEVYTVKQGKEVLDDQFEFGGEGVGPESRRPAALTVKPTTSTNFARPYTVAAGWERYPAQGRLPSEQVLGTLSVMFRDGTLWNYYNVELSFWLTFQASMSKGQFINKHAQNPRLNSYAHGPADISGAPLANRAAIQRISREAQVLYRDKRIKNGPVPVTKGGQGRFSKRPRKR